MNANSVKLLYAAFFILSCFSVYLNAYFLSSVYRVLAGFVLCYFVFMFRKQISNKIYILLQLSQFLMIIPFCISTPFDYIDIYYVLIFYLFSAIVQIQMIKSEGTHIFQKKYNKFAYLIIFTFLCYLQLLNNVKLSDTIFFLYVAFGIVRGIHFWLTINRDAKFKSYYIGIAATAIITFSEMLWALKSFDLGLRVGNMLVVLMAFFHFLGDFLLVESTIRNSHGK